MHFLNLPLPILKDDCICSDLDDPIVMDLPDPQWTPGTVNKKKKKKKREREREKEKSHKLASKYLCHVGLMGDSQCSEAVNVKSAKPKLMNTDSHF